MDFTDRNGNNYPESFWCASEISINALNGTTVIVFSGFKSIADFEAGEQPIPAIQGGEWRKTFTGNAHHRIIAKHAEAVGITVGAAWAIANSVKDSVGENGNFESFFAGAGAVIVPPSQ